MCALVHTYMQALAVIFDTLGHFVITLNSPLKLAVALMELAKPVDQFNPLSVAYFLGITN